MRVVLDTNVVVAAMRSPSGASAAVLFEAANGRLRLLASAALCFEYEAVCRRGEHLAAARLSIDDVDGFLNALIDLVEPVLVNFSWRPQLIDPGDELVLEAAVNGSADAIATFNRRDFLPAAVQFGISIVSPAELLGRLPR